MLLTTSRINRLQQWRSREKKVLGLCSATKEALICEVLSLKSLYDALRCVGA